MYSPKIREEHIPSLYQLAKQLGVPMTRLVNSMIVTGIEQIKRGMNDANDRSESRGNSK